MNTDELHRRVSRLEKELVSFSEELRRALDYMHDDAASSLTKSRMILEKLVLKIYLAEMGKEPRKPLLGEMLAENQFTRTIERRILSRMNAIRDLGNLGPHGEHVDARDATHVLDNLCEVLEWYLARQGIAVPTPAPGAGRQQLRPRMRRGRLLWPVALVTLAGLGLGVWQLAKPRENNPVPNPEQPVEPRDDRPTPIPGQPDRFIGVGSKEEIDQSEIDKLKP